jgi:hypothetical protein
MNTFTISGILHDIGNENCTSCDGEVVEGPCRCGGLVHSQVLNQYDEYVAFKCDQCER